jgi:hypothetical protein
MHGARKIVDGETLKLHKQLAERRFHWVRPEYNRSFAEWY